MRLQTMLYNMARESKNILNMILAYKALVKKLFLEHDFHQLDDHNVLIITLVHCTTTDATPLLVQLPCDGQFCYKPLLHSCI